MVLDHKTRRVVRSVEVTSGPGKTLGEVGVAIETHIKGGPTVGASKSVQMAKEDNIRAQGPVCVLRPSTSDEYIMPVELKTEVWRVA